MAKYDSPIGSKQFSGSPMRDFSVPDETNYEQQPANQHRRMNEAPMFDEQSMREFHSQVPGREAADIEKEFATAKKAKREGKERLSEGARRRIEMLLGMTKSTREIDINGQLYKLQTLSSQELREATVATAEFDGRFDLIFENRKQLLARSITVVASVPINQFLNSDDLDVKLEFVELMDHALLHRLYTEYVNLTKEAQDKYSLKTEEQVREIVEDLKK